MQFIDKVAGVPDSAVPKDSIVDSVQDIPVVQPHGQRTSLTPAPGHHSLRLSPTRRTRTIHAASSHKSSSHILSKRGGAASSLEQTQTRASNPMDRHCHQTNVSKS